MLWERINKNHFLISTAARDSGRRSTPIMGRAQGTSVWPALWMTTITGGSLGILLWQSMLTRNFLTTWFLHGTGILPYLCIAGLLIVPTPLASIRAGRSKHRIRIACLLYGIGGGLAFFLLFFADFHNRNDFGYLVLLGLLCSIGVCRLFLGRIVMRRMIRRTLKTKLSDEKMICFLAAFMGCTLPENCCGAVGRLGDNKAYTVLCAIGALGGKLFRLCQGSPVIPSQLFIEEADRNVRLSIISLYKELRLKGCAKKINRLSASLLRYMFIYFKITVLFRKTHTQAWPIEAGKNKIDSDDVLLADFENAYLLLLQSGFHPQANEYTRQTAWLLVQWLSWTLHALEVTSDSSQGALEYLKYAVNLRPDEQDGMSVYLNVQNYEQALDEEKQSVSRAEDIATCLIAQRLWERRFYHLAMELANDVAYSPWRSNLIIYVRYCIHMSLQKHHASMHEGDRIQIQAMATEDAVWCNAPDLYWEDYEL